MWNKYIVHKDFVEVLLPKKRGGVITTIIDHGTLEEMRELDITWYAAYSPQVKSYYVIGFDGDKQIKMHRLINKCPDDLVVDHINRNTLDNRKENLRNTTTQINALNTKLDKRNKTGVRGVFYRESRNRYVASLRINGKSKQIGQFKTLEEAEQAIKKARLDLYGGEINGVL